MPDQLTADVVEDAVIAPALPAQRYGRVARYVSIILAPAPVSVCLIILVALYHAGSLLAALVYACITLCFLSCGPLIYILLGVRLGKLSDAEVSRRRERKGPFLFSIASITAGLLVLMSMHGPKPLETVLVGTIAGAVIMMLITLWWKISIHASTLAGTLTMLAAIYGAIVLPAFMLLVLVSWSRVALRRHTLAQVIVGSLLGIILSAIVIKLVGV